MPRPAGAGRKAGTPNKKTQALHDLAESLGVSPFEILLLVAKGDWKALGIPLIEIKKDGQLVETKNPVIDIETRVQAAKEACKYLHPQRKAVELSTDENTGFRIVVEEYKPKDVK